ncbi:MULTISPECIES: glycosyltransferase [unclassified Coleofasciculus]|uniref:glycosyltransferase n=1 Tax=unclassified Coleofasciculus TaxID=2692782 RepID=UPI00187E384D|nr:MULTISPECIES: glycosyltransferase [unclassified Coleofasciculus]MBE9125826.1 glycosyltransferase [Coleofasciculus sp. LEGE 07081]MBE9148989.1 glycosyltransferase [Coleofasciculus sp. LEGE 07092]
MYIGFLNPQGNFNSSDSYITEHSDFGGQLVYVKHVALAIAKQGHKVDILTRQIIDPDWPEFAEPFDAYPGVENVRIVRLPAGPKDFLRKELLWPHLVRDWIPNILKFYQEQGRLPDVMTAHYADGGLGGVLIEEETGIPFTFTAHSLGAQKMDKLNVTPENLTELNEYYHFRRRLLVERLSMNRSAINITNTGQERFKQYAHPAYRGAVDISNDAHFAAIPPGVDPSMFSAEVRSDNEDATYQLVQEKLARDISESRRDFPVILASSRLDPKKNLLGLVQAFAHSEGLQERANLVLITGGLDNPLHEKAKDEPTERMVLSPIRQVVNDSNLWGKISAFCVPDQPALAATYRFLAQRRSVFALTSLFEPFGLAPLEAAAAGLPVVVTQNGGITESLRDEDEEYGVMVNPEDPADIAQGLERLLYNPQEWEHFARIGQQQVLSKHTWESTAKGYLSVIEQILSSPRANRSTELLPIPPYFSNPQPDNEISLEELSRLYFGG